MNVICRVLQRMLLALCCCVEFRVEVNYVLTIYAWDFYTFDKYIFLPNLDKVEWELTHVEKSISNLYNNVRTYFKKEPFGEL